MTNINPRREREERALTGSAAENLAMVVGAAGTARVVGHLAKAAVAIVQERHQTKREQITQDATTVRRIIDKD